MTPIAVMGFVIEAIQNIESLLIERFLATSAKPKASMAMMPSGPTTAVTAPVITSLSTKCCSANAVTAFSLSGIGLSGLQPVRRRRPRIRLKKRMRD